MYLERLTLQGFKTFAKKTELVFLLDKTGRRGMTAVVGPNGSGKSNIADALRWVMGEQSLKFLRGKKSEDMIFSGSDKRTRSGFAEVEIHLVNDDHAELDMSEISVMRRLYRDGKSEYLINQKVARLQDVVYLLSQIGMSQRAYSVIGQGMIDYVLVVSPQERREFFDEAFGLRPLQLKRLASLQKLATAQDNLRQTEVVLQEIEPRLASLERHVKRQEQRGSIEEKLRSLERQYYCQSWYGMKRSLQAIHAKVELAQKEQQLLDEESSRLEEDLSKLEKGTSPSEGFRELRSAMDRLTDEHGKLREQLAALETRKAVAAVRAEKSCTPLPLSKIIESIKRLCRWHESLDQLVHADAWDKQKLSHLAGEMRQVTNELLIKLQRPAPEERKEEPTDPTLVHEQQEIAKALATLVERITKAQTDMDAWHAQEEKKRTDVFHLQHTLNRKRHEVQQAERKANEHAVELAKQETRFETLVTEIRQFAPNLIAEFDSSHVSPVQSSEPLPADATHRLQQLRSQLEWIGVLDPETIKEHRETKDRYAFLSLQAEDVKNSMTSLRTIIQELDQTLQERSKKAFRALDQEFRQYFQKLFGGGDASLVEMRKEEKDEVSEIEGNLNAEDEEKEPEIFTGIEIHATPPGKRFKSVAFLSGGERALTSIALICAIVATNPSPFVILDEVDAALDESNSRKFAEIIDGLAHKTQFIIVTHNRATMAQAHILYGVTMGDDGISRLLSVKLDDVKRIAENQMA